MTAACERLVAPPLAVDEAVVLAEEVHLRHDRADRGEHWREDLRPCAEVVLREPLAEALLAASHRVPSLDDEKKLEDKLRAGLNQRLKVHTRLHIGDHPDEIVEFLPLGDRARLWVAPRRVVGHVPPRPHAAIAEKGRAEVEDAGEEGAIHLIVAVDDAEVGILLVGGERRDAGHPDATEGAPAERFEVEVALAKVG